jgi:class 3 adenylate cyclase
MAVCASCGAENRDEARFCDACGTALAERAAPREVRKVVTVLFCDVTGSTALGERIDPESLRRVLARYFETAKTIVERHGGTVEKFIGDAVMAAFGVPAVHEDDALRAVRAADELRAGLDELNDELEQSYGTRLELRMGLNTGEVVTGTEERLATGDAVNVAARLEQAAVPGEVLLGEETLRLVRAVVDTEPVEPLAAKGKAEPLPAYRLRAVRDGDVPRRGDAPMVGRERQLQLLEHAFASATAERSCHLFTILGSAGVGKSRLAEEFLSARAGAAVPGLLDRRPSWGGGKLNATNVLLEPLASGEAGELIDSLASEIPAELRGRILDAAEGNPLFVEEMVAMTSEDGNGDVVVPPTIQALLAARLDQLEPAERGVLERGAVEGLVFHRSAVAALAPDDARVDGRLVTLVRKDLVRPEQAVLPDDDAYRFRHLLIRDTAYDALPKAVRADLHERFAVWLEEHGASLVELDEIVGFHLEQAYRYRLELGPLDTETAALGGRAAERLLRGAKRADERGDKAAARALFGRGVELMQPDHPGYGLAQLELAAALLALGEFDAAAALREEVAAAARANGDKGLLARSELVRVEIAVQSDPNATMRDSIATVEEALATLEEIGDEEGAVSALVMLATFTGWAGRGQEMLRLLQGTRERAARVSPRVATELGVWMAFAIWWGLHTPTDEGIVLCDELIAGSTSKRLEGVATLIRGLLKAERGRLEEGRADVAAGRGLMREIGPPIWWAGSSMGEADLELSAGNAEGAYAVVAEGRAALAESRETGYLASVIAIQAQAAVELGREDEALRLADEAEAVSQADDFDPHARIGIVRGRVAARRGDIEAAEQFLGVVEELLAPTDNDICSRDLRFARAEVERLAGRAEGERAALEEVVAASGDKGDLTSAERARKRLAEL